MSENVNELVNQSAFRRKNPDRESTLPVRITGAVLGIFTLGVIAYFLIREQNFAPPVSISSLNSIQKIMLPDNSQVTLNQNSEVTFPKTYKKDLREVFLKGEGFFNVVHNAEKPFIVHTQLADVRVIGTSFNVSMNRDHLEVGVAEGKVLVMTPTDSLYVQAGGLALTDENKLIHINPDVDENTWGYATKKFTFKNTALRDVFATIKKSTSYSFRFDNTKIENCELTATFENISTDEMVHLIAESLDLSAIKNGSVFTLQGDGCP